MSGSIDDAASDGGKEGSAVHGARTRGSFFDSEGPLAECSIGVAVGLRPPATASTVVNFLNLSTHRDTRMQSEVT